MSRHVGDISSEGGIKIKETGQQPDGREARKGMAAMKGAGRWEAAE